MLYPAILSAAVIFSALLLFMGLKKKLIYQNGGGWLLGLGTALLAAVLLVRPGSSTEDNTSAAGASGPLAPAVENEEGVPAGVSGAFPSAVENGTGVPAGVSGMFPAAAENGEGVPAAAAGTGERKLTKSYHTELVDGQLVTEIYDAETGETTLSILPTDQLYPQTGPIGSYGDMDGYGWFDPDAEYVNTETGEIVTGRQRMEQADALVNALRQGDS